jgi:hypothetical protein
MDAPEYFELADGYAIYRPVGDIPLQQAIDWISKVITYSVEQKIPKLLVDSTRLTGLTPPLTWDRFRMAERFARAARGAYIKVVLIALPEMLDPRRLGVTVARNRGLFANVFTSEPEAVAWLLDPNAV